METGTKYSEQELREAFALIENKENWKSVINALIPADKLDVCKTAAGFYAGSPLEVVAEKDGMCFVHGAGYYACVGA